MGSVRLFVDAPLAEGAAVAAAPGQAHYLAAVMRRRPGDPVCLFNGQDGEWQGRIVRLRRAEAEFAVERQIRPQKSEPDLWLLFALLKRDATDMVVQKATELGVSAILPVLTERSVSVRTNQDRLRTIATEAAEQSERLTVPRITLPQSLPHVLAEWQPPRTLFAAVERIGAPALTPTCRAAALLIGPEGGFSPRELDLLRQYPFVAMVTLGPRILRAETACIAGLAVLQAALRPSLLPPLQPPLRPRGGGAYR